MDKQELSTLCNKHNINLQQKIINRVAANILTMTDSDWLDLFIDFGYDNPLTVNYVRSGAIGLYNLLISKGYVKSNVFNSRLLETNNILKATATNVYISPKRFNLAIDRITNKEVGECILRLFYEGVSENRSLYDIKLSDMDLENKKITMPKFTIEMSDSLARAIVNYNEAEKMGRYTLTQAHIGGFVKTVNYENTSDSFVSFANYVKRTVSQTGLKKANIYASGFMNYLYKKCGNVSSVKELFFSYESKDLNTEAARQLVSLANEYGMFAEGKYIRRKFKKYAECFKYEI